MLFAAALALLVLWIAVVILSDRAARRAEAPGRARGWNATLLGVTAAAWMANCAAPVVPLMQGFEAVAATEPSRKADVLNGIIEANRPAMPLALVGIVILGAGSAFLAKNRRTRKAAAATAARTGTL